MDTEWRSSPEEAQRPCQSKPLVAVSVQWAQAEALTATQEGHTAGVAGAPLTGGGGGRLDNDLCFGREPK